MTKMDKEVKKQLKVILATLDKELTLIDVDIIRICLECTYLQGQIDQIDKKLP